MPIRKDIHTVLVIGSGPIVIGQACEFDYSGTQACRALREAGKKVVLLNSNPATIMTDVGMADRTYIEPMTPRVVEEIVRRERVDAILPTMGGQTALNLIIALDDRGFFRKHPVKLIGAGVRSIRKSEDRELFKKAMQNIGLETPRSGIASSLSQAGRIARRLGFPVILRPSFTMGGAGAGIARNPKELSALIGRALALSPVGEVLVEESVLGWKEFELEVIRDSADNVIVVCSIENVDPMGVHTGDSVTVAPAQTLSDELFQELRNSAKKIIREIGVDTGGANIQFAVHPRNRRILVIEMNPRVSRSSALASKATGYPIAKVAAKLALGLTLDEIKNDVTGVTPASFEPSVDYVVTKLPRFAFEKFAHADETLDTQMKSVGEVMAIGRNFKESLQKAVRGLEIGRAGLAADGRGMEPAVIDALRSGRTHTRFRRMLRLLCHKIVVPNCDRLFAIKYALMLGEKVDVLAKRSGIDPWFIENISQMALFERRLCSAARLRPDDLRTAKLWGYSDEQIAFLCGSQAGQIRPASETPAPGAAERLIRQTRQRLGIVPSYARVDTCAAEFDSVTPYYYSTYAAERTARPSDRASRSRKRPVVILGGGPNRIGQGIEFDYCCVQAALALKQMGRPVVMVNCNPETVSTDPDVSDRLYFEPLTAEDVLNIVEREDAQGVIVQFGGQTPIHLCHDLVSSGSRCARILGTSAESIDRAEDRQKFDDVLRATGLLRPENGMARTAQDARQIVRRLGFPVLIRPSYVLGGLGMKILFDEEGLRRYLTDVFSAPDRPILIDRYLRDAVEIDVDAVSDGVDTAVVGILEHVEEAGVHSGDSACFYPPTSLSSAQIDQIRASTAILARAIRVVGLINVQFAMQRGRLYVLEVNPRASRTVPFVSKASGVPLVSIATRLILGARLKRLLDPNKLYFPKRFCVKESVLPFLKFSNTDIGLGPEMRSTGEVMGVSSDAGLAFAKSQEAAGFPLPRSGRVLVSVQDSDKPGIFPVARDLAEMGFTILATPGTAAFLSDRGLSVSVIPRATAKQTLLRWISEGTIQMVLNTFRSTAAYNDAVELRRAALMAGIPVLTTASAARWAVSAIRSLKTKKMDYKCLQEWV